MKLETTDKKEKRTVRRVSEFLGESGLVSAYDGYMTSTLEVSADAYPSLTTAAPLSVYKSADFLNYPTSIGSDGKLYYADGDDFVYDGKFKGKLEEVGKKHFGELDEQVVIFPDRCVYSHKTHYYYFAEYRLNELVDLSGITTVVPLRAIADAAPPFALDGDMYFNTADNLVYTYNDGTWSGETPLIDVTYSLEEDSFDSLVKYVSFLHTSDRHLTFERVNAAGETGSTHIKIVFSTEKYPAVYSGLKNFAPGDRVFFRGITTYNDGTENNLYALANGTTITEIADEYIIVENTVGMKNVFADPDGSIKFITMVKVVPPLECVVRVGNRLWGAVGDKIYASAANNPREWSPVRGGVVIKAETMGKILGACELSGTPVFFTERSVIKVIAVSGGYKLSVTPALGLSPDSRESIACVSGAIYYLSNHGVMCYSGTVPKKVDFMCTELKGGAMAASDGARYYLSMGDKVFVYTPENKTWYRRNINAKALCNHNATVAFIHEKDGSREIGVLERGTTGSAAHAVFAPWDTDILEKKKYRRLYIEMIADKSAKVTVTALYDSTEVSANTLTGTGKLELYKIELLPYTADRLTLTLSTRANVNFTVKSISREFSLCDT